MSNIYSTEEEIKHNQSIDLFVCFIYVIFWWYKKVSSE